MLQVPLDEFGPSNAPISYVGKLLCQEVTKCKTIAYNTRHRGNILLAYCLGPTWASLHIDLMNASPPGSARTRPPDLVRTTSNAGSNFAYEQGLAQEKDESDNEGSQYMFRHRVALALMYASKSLRKASKCRLCE
jgi:hypothetical protein